MNLRRPTYHGRDYCMAALTKGEFTRREGYHIPDTLERWKVYAEELGSHDGSEFAGTHNAIG